MPNLHAVVVLLSDSYFYFFGRTQNYSKVLNHKPFSFFSNDKLVNRDIPKLQKLIEEQQRPSAGLLKIRAAKEANSKREATTP